jgi:zinc protease
MGSEFQYSKENALQIQALAEILQIRLTDRLREEESGVYSPSCRVSVSKVPSQRYSFYVNFGCSPDNVEKLINATLDEINKIRQNGASNSDIEKYKAEDKRDTEEQLTDNGFWAGYLSSKYLSGEDPKEIQSAIKDLDKITTETTKATAIKYLSGENLIKVVLLPEKK